MAAPLRHVSLRARSLARDTALRALGGLSRRLDRPEIMSVVDAGMRQAQYDAIASRAIVAAVLGPACTYVDVGTNRGQWLADACRCAPRRHAPRVRRVSTPSSSAVPPARSSTGWPYPAERSCRRDGR